MASAEEEHFIDWEGHVFGLGYGSEEEHILAALKGFLAKVPGNEAYDHAEIEKTLGGAVTWLLITALCKADIIEYGSSPRFGWLTAEGQRLKAFVDARSAEELIGLIEAVPLDRPMNYPGVINEDRGVNPFWVEPATPTWRG